MNAQMQNSPALNQQKAQSIAIEQANAFELYVDLLDRFAPLCEGSHADVSAYGVYYQHLVVYMKDGSTTGLRNTRNFISAYGHFSEPESIILGDEFSSAEITVSHQGEPLAISWTAESLARPAA